MKKWFLVLLFPSLLFSIAQAQSVAVSTYFNAADPRDEWIELIVLTDNTDMRSWTIRDNNSSQNSWQTAITFNNIAFWNNMRAGTIIMIWNRVIASDGSTAHPSDVNKDDGYIELNAQNTTYFTGGSFGSSPTWAGNSLNFAGGGDVLQLRDASATHVHALGHISTPGTDWTALPSPKLNHNNNANSGDAIYVCPGSGAADYGTNTPQAGTTWTSKNNSTITFGLPNSCGSSATANAAYWYSLREPQMSAQTVTPTAVPGSPGSISFSWTAATDPNSADGYQGYIILRNTSNSFTAPADGTTYTNGATLGTATVLTHLTSSTTTSYTDNTVMNGNAYYYRVYAYRYTTDNVNGNTYDAARGRAYNTTNFVQVDYPTPLPVNLLSFHAQPGNNVVALDWSTASESNNAYFSVERSDGTSAFTEVARVAGAGNSDQLLNYRTTDEAPLDGVSYYRLRQTDFNGQTSYSATLAVSLKAGENAFHVFYGEEGRLFFSFSCMQSSRAQCEILDMAGRIVYSETLDCSGSLIKALPEDQLGKGIYLLRITDGARLLTQKFVR